MFVLKNGHAKERSGVNCHAKCSHLKQLLKKYSSSYVSTILLTDEKIFTVITLKNLKNYQLYATAATKKTLRQNACAHGQNSESHWWHQSASHTWSKTHKFHTCLSRSWGYWRLLSYCDAVITVTARHTLHLKRVLRLSAGAYGAWDNQLG